MSTPSDPNGPLQPPPQDAAWQQPSYPQQPPAYQAPQPPQAQTQPFQPVEQTQAFQNPYGQAQYGQAQPPQYGQAPYGQAQGQYGQAPYDQNPYAQNPYQQPYQGAPGFAPAQAPKHSAGKRALAIISAVLVVIIGIAVRVGLRHAFTHNSSYTPPVNVSVPAIPSNLAGGLSSPSGGGSVGSADYAIGDCMDLQGTSFATDSKVGCSESTANYKVLQVISGVTGTISTDAKQCYPVAGNDDEFDKSASDGTVYLYCLGSTSAKHSPRRAQKGDCLDAPSSTTDFYLVACSDPLANYVILARFDGTNDTAKCDSVSGSTETFTLSNDPQVLLCGKGK